MELFSRTCTLNKFLIAVFTMSAFLICAFLKAHQTFLCCILHRSWSEGGVRNLKVLHNLSTTTSQQATGPTAVSYVVRLPSKWCNSAFVSCTCKMFKGINAGNRDTAPWCWGGCPFCRTFFIFRLIHFSWDLNENVWLNFRTELVLMCTMT